MEHGAAVWTSPCLPSASRSAWEISGAFRTCATEEAEVSDDDDDDDNDHDTMLVSTLKLNAGAAHSQGS